MPRLSVLCLLAAVATAVDYCSNDANEFSCENDKNGCFWCTVDKGATYLCYDLAKARSLKAPSCSHPVPAPTPPPAPPAPTPPPTPPTPPPPTPAPGPCFDYTVRGGDTCWAIETYYGTDNVTHKGVLCEKSPLAIGEALEVCGCTKECPLGPEPKRGVCLNHTVVSGEYCKELATYFNSTARDITCETRLDAHKTPGPCPPGPYCDDRTPMFIGDVVQVCFCHQHCDETMPPTPPPTPAPPTPPPTPVPPTPPPTPPTPAPPTPPPTPAAPTPPPTPQTRCQRGLLKCVSLDPEAFCGPGATPSADFNDGSGCACDYGYTYDKTTHHCAK